MVIFTKTKPLFLFFLILSLFLASQCNDDQNPRGQDPRRQLESCLRQCQAQGETPEQQLSCQRSCVSRYERQQRERSEEVIEDVILMTQNRDPEKTYRECQQRCERQQPAGQQRQLCKQRCQQEHRGERGQDTEEDNPGRQGQRDPERRFRECQQRCQRQEQGPQQQQCQQRCQQEYRREQEEERRGQEETRDENQGRGQRDPERRFRECQQRCQRQEQGPQQQQCQQRCQQEYRREQEEERRGHEEMTDENQGRGQRDPERRFRECQQRCQRQEQGPQQQQCQQRCQQEYRREQEEERRGHEEMTDENQGRGQRDPERRFRECQQRCQRQEQGPQQQQCQQRCQQEYRREQEEERRGQEIGEEGIEQLNTRGRDPERRFRECQQRCQRQEQGQQQQQCQQRCQQEYRREQEQHRRGQETELEETNPEREREEENNPYLFDSQRFSSRFKASHGDFRILEKFTQRSQLLRGLEKYRVAIVEFEPQSFMIPHHCDGEAIFVVAKGQGIISIANQDEKNSFNLQQGDVIRVPSGSTVYMLNKDNNERFFVYVLAKSVNAPGEFQEYFSAGGQNPESFYRAFSSDILETAFNTPRDRLERLFGQQKQGIIIKATEEQIRAISQHASRSTKQTKGETRGPFNLLKERPKFDSRFGQYFEASPEEFEQLRDLDAAVSFMNINQGGMILPFYNSRSTRLVKVVEGNGRFEMACPHLGRQRQGHGSRGERREQEQEREEGDVHYQKVRGNLKVGDVLVVPAGHPITVIATGNSNLRMVAFGINAQNNKKNFLAGKQSIWRNIDREAKELSFNTPGREVEEIFQKQDESFFVAGPEQHRQQQRGQEQQHLSSILDFVF